MSSIIDQFLSIKANNTAQDTDRTLLRQYKCVWHKIQQQIDQFDEYCIIKVLKNEIQRNQDLVQELNYLLQIQKEYENEDKDESKQKNNDKISIINQSLFEIPERQLLQKQIILNLKEIKSYSQKSSISIKMLLPFDKNSIHHQTLMYIIKPSTKTLTATNHQKRPHTSFSIANQNDIVLSSEQDIIQQTRSALNDEKIILLSSIDQIRCNIDKSWIKKISDKKEKIEKQFVPCTNQLESLCNELQNLCDSFLHKSTSKCHPKKLKPLKPLKHAKKYSIPSKPLSAKNSCIPKRRTLRM